MKSKVLAMIVIGSLAMLASCETKQVTQQSIPLTEEELIARGEYLTTIGACNDCHSPKTMTPNGPEPDPRRRLSGHPQNEPLPPITPSQDWISFTMGLTGFVGPWGVSYAANLTPDETGIGNWTYEQFETAIRKGKSKGLEHNRPLLPPMPWTMYKDMTDEDLRAVYAYLRSLPPVNNLVPAPVPPDKMQPFMKTGL